MVTGGLSRADDLLQTVRRIGRVAQILLDLRNEYERRPRADLLDQISERIVELNGMSADLGRPVGGSPSALPGDEGL